MRIRVPRTGEGCKRSNRTPINCWIYPSWKPTSCPFTSRGENLTKFIRRWLNPLTDLATAQGLTLTFHSDVTGDYWFDAEKPERIVYNLAANALKFINVGTITVSLTEASERVCLPIADTGVGIPAQHLPHIFDRFYRVGCTQDDANSTLVRVLGWRWFGNWFSCRAGKFPS